MVEVVAIHLGGVAIHLTAAPASAALCIHCNAKMSARLTVGVSENLTFDAGVACVGVNPAVKFGR
jgi:hypothetical protein